MSDILKYSISVVIICIASISFTAYGNNSARNYPNIVFPISPEINLPANISEKQESDTISTNKDTKPVKNTIVNVLDGPDVDFTFTNDNTCAGTKIEFTSNVTEGKTPYKYTWNFDDGETSDAENPTHRYTSLGCDVKEYEVKLDVTDADGNTEEKIKTISVKQLPNISFSDPDDEFGNDPFNNCDNASDENPSYSVTVNNNSSSGSCIDSYSINWGDGNTETNITFPINHTYEHLGAFKMVITAKGKNGCDNDVLFTVKNQTNPSGGINSPGETAGLCAPTEELGFTISEWGKNAPGTRYEVDYADGSGIYTFYQDDMMTSEYYNANEPSSSRNFPIPHSYKISNCPEEQFIVKMDIINECLTTPASVGGITVYAVPEANFTAPSACVNSSVTFTNTTISGYDSKCRQQSNFTWDFGDGSEIIKLVNVLPQDISHTYTVPGVYNVTLTAKNSSCGETSKTKQITISEAPTATISGDAEICLGDIPPTITFTGANSTPPYSFTYRINNGSTQTVAAPANSNSATIQVSTSAAGTFTYTLTSVSGASCSQAQTGNVVINVNPAPTATISGSTKICIDDNEPALTLTGQNGVAPYTFTYNINGGTSQTITTTSGNTTTINAPTASDGVYVYNLLGVTDAGSSTCSVTQTGSATITVNKKPPPPITLSDQEYCNGETTATISFSNNQSGSTFEWTNSNPDIGLSSTGTGNIQPFKANNSTTNSITATITVIAIENGCISENETFTITVHPSASVTFSEPKQIICSGETNTKILLNSITSGAELSWSTTQPVGITPDIALAGTTSIEPETLTNTTDAPIDIIYKAKATLTGITQCSGIEYIYTITINPKPEIPNNYTDTICTGTSFNIMPQNGDGNVIPAGTQYTWNMPVINPAGSIRGASEQTEPQVSISQTLVNTTSVITSVTYSVTPSVDNCPVNPFEVTIYVIPGAVINPINNIELCSGDVNQEIDLGTPPEGTKFKWTTDDSDIGLPGSSGDNTIPEFTATNSGTSPIIANIKVESENIGTSDCETNPIFFSITVNPRPVVSGSRTDTICSSTTFNIVPQNGSGTIIPPATKYTWSQPIITPAGAIIGASEQTEPQGSISQTLINTSTVIATATYNVIPTTNSCIGQQFEVIVYVVPGATLPSTNNITLCNQEINKEIDFGNSPEGITYQWTADNKYIGLPGFSGSGNIPEFKAINNGTSPITVTITVTPEGDFRSSDCGGPPIQFSITVNPTGQVDNPENNIDCSGQNILINFTTQNTEGTTTYEWTNSDANIGLETSGKGDISFKATNTQDSAITATITVSPIFSNNEDSCMGPSEQFTITINPIPNVNQPENQNVCNGNNTTEIVFTGDIPNAIYYWSISDTSIGFPKDGVDSIPEIEVVNNQLDSIEAIITVIPSFNGCLGTPKIFTITVYPSAVILKQPSPSSICLGEKPVALSVIHTTGVKPPTYQWYSNTSNSTIGGTMILNATDYKFDPPNVSTNTMFYYCVITFSNGGCGNLTTTVTRVDINPNPIVVLNDEQISEGDELKFCEGDTIFIKASGAETYSWNAGASGDSMSVHNIGPYRVIGISNKGCKDTFNFSAAYFNLRYYTIQTDKDEITNEQNQVHLWSEEIPPSYYTWFFGDSLTGSGYDVTHTYDITQDGYFDVKLKIINPDGCLEEATKRIWTSLESFPNTFTPNGDGLNDYYMKGWRIQIYNRNGVLLYEGEEGWDGTYKGSPVANDTYFVIIYDTSESETAHKTNYVTVIR